MPSLIVYLCPNYTANEFVTGFVFHPCLHVIFKHSCLVDVFISIWKLRLCNLCSWNALKDQMDDMLAESDRKGIMVPRVRKINRKTSVYTYPLPECRCLQQSLVNITVDHNVGIPDNYSRRKA